MTNSQAAKASPRWALATATSTMRSPGTYSVNLYGPVPMAPLPELKSAVVDVPADPSPPDVVYWGYRTFVLIAGTGGDYREAVTATVPVLPPVEPFARG